MKTIQHLMMLLLLTVLLAGCNETLGDLKKAASGIGNEAQNAAVAISQDVHSIRAIEITHNNETFTVNDLFKSILRDVQWHYDEKTMQDVLKITGTWQPNLFEEAGMDISQKDQLQVEGKTTIYITVKDHKIIEDETKVNVTMNGEVLFEQSGKEILTYMYDYYTQK